MALSGVRSSWDMLARNSDLCWLATSSSRLLPSISRKSRAFWMARADWVANVFRISTTSAVNSPGVRPAHDEAPDDALLVEQRDREQRARPRLEQRAAQPALVGAFRRDVRDLDRLPRHRHLADGAFACDGVASRGASRTDSRPH